jgi:hypothetical protein
MSLTAPKIRICCSTSRFWVVGVATWQLWADNQKCLSLCLCWSRHLFLLGVWYYGSNRAVLQIELNLPARSRNRCETPTPRVGKGVPGSGIERVPSLAGVSALDHQATPAARLSLLFFGILRKITLDPNSLQPVPEIIYTFSKCWFLSLLCAFSGELVDMDMVWPDLLTKTFNNHRASWTTACR